MPEINILGIQFIQMRTTLRNTAGNNKTENAWGFYGSTGVQGEIQVKFWCIVGNIKTTFELVATYGKNARTIKEFLNL